MAKRTQTFSMYPWVGGVVTSQDESLLQPGQLTVGDNLIFDYQTSKKRREGIKYNYDSTVFTVTSRSSAGTARTLTGSFTTGLIVGDKITIRSAGSTSYNVTLGAITAISGTAITYTATTSLTESSTAETTAKLGNKVVGGIDFWFGTSDSKAQYLITVLDNGAVYRTSSGVRVRITDGGRAWTIPSAGLTEANCEVFNNKVVIAVSGVTNQMKYWNGDTNTSLTDLPGNLVLTSVSRSSAGTTRTIVFSGNVTIANTATIVIEGGPATYNGTYTLLSGTGTATITYTASSSLTEGSTADTAITIGAFAPLASFLRQHLGSLWCNDKTNLDRIHYSGPSLHNRWNGLGSSGALDIGIGDGDPAGLTGIAPTLKGDLFVGKRTKLYRLVGQNPDTVAVYKQSNGIGFLSHQSVLAIDQDDLYFVSDRGIHSLAAVNAYGDFSTSYLSKDIQRTFVEDWDEGRRKFIKAAYFPQINSAAFAVSENGSTYNNSLWLYNIPMQIWYRWPNIEAESLISTQDTDRRRAYFGTLSGRLAQTLTSRNVDTDELGVTSTIVSRSITGLIFPDGRPDTIKAFKRLQVLFRATGSYTITAKIKIDNFAEQALALVSNEQALPLGNDPNGGSAFVLGQSVMGGSFVLAPYSLPIDGYGRGFKITVEQSDLNTALAIQGLTIEFEGGGDQPETRLGDSR